MSSQFFTILKTYFQCCANRCSCCFNKKVDDEHSRDNTYSSQYSDSSPFSFDDISNPRTPGSSGSPGTPMTWSSSSSSLESYNTPYKRHQFKPYVGIIPANYYSD